MSSGLPPCGLYQTTGPIGGVSAGRLVYFHNHGDPGPGIYLPVGWSGNRARFDSRGTTLPDPSDVSLLRPLPAEGLYRVVEKFTCCEKRCREFLAEDLVQLGYNGQASPILFTPHWGDAGLVLPERGTGTSLDRLTHLRLLRVGARPAARPADPGGPESFLH